MFVPGCGCIGFSFGMGGLGDFGMSGLCAGFCGGSPMDFRSCSGSTEFCLLRPCVGCPANDVLLLRVIDTLEPPPPRISESEI